MRESKYYMMWDFNSKGVPTKIIIEVYHNTTGMSLNQHTVICSIYNMHERLGDVVYPRKRAKRFRARRIGLRTTRGFDCMSSFVDCPHSLTLGQSEPEVTKRNSLGELKD
jgi:hypothetical protein